MNHQVFELLLAGAFATAAMALGTLNAIGLLVWLAGCRPSAPGALVSSRPAVAANPASALSRASDREFGIPAGPNVPPLEQLAPKR